MIPLARKLVVYVITAWVAITANFLLPRLMPGNPITTMIGKLQGRVTPAMQKAIQLQFGVGLHESLWTQYVNYWSQLFHGNLGQSITLSSPVSTVLGGTLPWTIGLLGVSTVISFVLGTLLGIALGWRRGSWLDGLLPLSTFFQAVPYFFLGTVLLLVFGSDLHWFPVLGNYQRGLTPGLNWTFIASVIRYAELPAITIVLSSIAGWMLGMRNMMVTTMDEDFVLVARAKGLSTRKVVTYAARSAILPSVANFSLAIGLVVSGALLVELVFNYPGVGNLLLQAVLNQDYPLLQGIFLVITLTVLAANLIADFVYVALDPRVRQEA
ncbi:MAG TPA: ABC transporter permease [Streptosporangiaceae bacterium]|nr:ABC transporter permease [Streptosporangiaceae bacterium]